MVRHVDDVSFFSLLHPEQYSSSAAATEEVNNNNSNSNTTPLPWAAVYNEAVSEFRDDSVPVAIQVVAVDEDCQDDTLSTSRAGGISRRRSHHEDDDSDDYDDDDLEHHAGTSSRREKKRKLQPWKHSNLVDLILGFSLTITCILVTVKMEIAAIIIYILAAGCQWLSDERLSAFQPLLMLLVAIFMFVDAVILTVSVLVTEIVGWLAHLLCTIFGGPRSGREWHQFIRKACHLTRWAFRNFHKGWKPERVFPIPMNVEASMLQQTEGLHETEQELANSGRGTTDNDEGSDRRRAYSDVAHRNAASAAGDRYRTYSDVPPSNNNRNTATASVISDVTFTEATAQAVNPTAAAAPPITLSPDSVVQVISEEGAEVDAKHAHSSFAARSLPPVPSNPSEETVRLLQPSAADGLKPDRNPLPQKRVLALVSDTYMNTNSSADQNRALTIFSSKNIPYEVVNGSDAAMIDRRNELFQVSRKKGVYPQFFIIDMDRTTFLGDMETIDHINDCSELAPEVLEANPNIVTWDKVLR